MQPFYSKLYFLYFLEVKNPCFVTKNCWKSSYICVFILSKKRRNWFHKNLHNSGMVGRRKLPDPSLNRIFNALSVGVQYTLSFQWTNVNEVRATCVFDVFDVTFFWEKVAMMHKLVVIHLLTSALLTESLPANVLELQPSLLFKERQLSLRYSQ